MRIDRLIEAVERTGNPSVLGLDPQPDYLPQSLQNTLPPENERTNEQTAQAIYSFNCALIDALCDIVPCAKLQAAWYEVLGPEGMLLFRNTLLYARQKGMSTIADVKRNDIGISAEAYAACYFGEKAPFPADFVTLNAYLGSDGIAPFLAQCEQNGNGVFVLVRTSNPSAGEFQDLSIDNRPLYELMGERVAQWGEALTGKHGYSSVGAVVGATWSEEGKKLRALLPRTFFLVPGYGAQGATAQDLRGCFDVNGSGAIVNASRSLMCAYKKRGTQDFAAAARDEALKMRDEIRAVLKAN